MTEDRASLVSIRAGLTRALVAALLVLAGLVAPIAGKVPAYAAPSSPVTAGAGDDAVVSQLRTDLEAYLQERGAAEHISAAGLSVSLPDHRSPVDHRRERRNDDGRWVDAGGTGQCLAARQQH